MIRYLRFPADLPQSMRSNFTYFFLDVACWSLYAGSITIFLTIYAARCGATTTQIGYLTALPALLMILLSLPVGQLIKRIPPRSSAIWSAFAMRIFFIGYAIIPWVLPITHQFTAILILGSISSIPATVLNVSFTQLYIECFPPEWRGAVLGGRGAIGSVVTFVVTLLCGQLLTRVPFPVNYQIVFFIGFVGAIATVYPISRFRPLNMRSAGTSLIADPPGDPKGGQMGSPLGNPEAAASSRRRSYLPKLDKVGIRYLRVIGFLFIYNLVANMVGPLIPNWLVHHLALSDAWISVGNATNTLVNFIASLFIIRIVRSIGNRKGNTLGISALSLTTLILSVARNPTHYMFSAVSGGLANGVLYTAQTNYLLEHVPQNDQPVWLSMNLWLNNIAIFAGALLGPLIASSLGMMPALIFFGCLEFGIGLVMLVWG